MTPQQGLVLEVLDDPAGVAVRVADWLLEIASAADRQFAIALSGGTTPRRLYELLAAPLFRDRFPWSRVHWFWGDERFVPHDNPLSNFRMVDEAMLSHVPALPSHIHPVRFEGLTAEASAAAYERELKTYYGAGQLDPARPLFDVVLLGLGEDGHTASLFTGTAVLAEQTRWVAAVIGAKSEARITLTYPALESTRHVAFLVTGKEKRSILSSFLGSGENLPAARVRPRAGDIRVFADHAAAG